MKAIITVIGKDQVGIMSKVSTACAECNVNILEVTQSVLQDTFAMIMLTEIDKSVATLGEIQDKMNVIGENIGMKIHVMHEDIFNSMHKI